MLKQDVHGTGKAGDIVTVSDGYASNFLIPRGLAPPMQARSTPQTSANRPPSIALKFSAKTHRLLQRT